MDYQKIPRNMCPDFCDNPNLLPVEFSRNSSLSANKLYALNASYEKIDTNEKKENSPINRKYDKRQNNLLDSKFTEQDALLDLSYDDLELNFKYSNDQVTSILDQSYDDEEVQLKILNNHSSSMRCYDIKVLKDAKAFFDDSIPFIDDSDSSINSLSFVETKSQKSLHKEAKRSSLIKSNNDYLKLNYCQLDSSADEKENSFGETSFSYESSVLSESMVVSPIAHEMSQINGQELSDVSNFFSETSIPFDSFVLTESMVMSPIAHEMSHINGQELSDVSNFF